MIVDLPDDLATSIGRLVQDGQFGSLDEAFAEAARLLFRRPLVTGLSPAEAKLFRWLIDAGLIAQIPNWQADDDDPADQPIDLKGEPRPRRSSASGAGMVGAAPFSKGMSIMTINLTPDLEASLEQLVQRGQYASLDEVIAAAARSFVEQQSASTQASRVAAAQRRMVASGLMSKLQDRANDYDDSADQPITIEGEPISETIIRERR